VEDHIQGRALLFEVSDDGDGAAHGLADGAVLSQLGKAAPLTDLGTGIGHDQVNAGLGAQSLHKLLVLLVVAVLGEDAQASTSTVKGLHAPNKYYGRKKCRVHLNGLANLMSWKIYGLKLVLMTSLLRC
jgi:hypothetical protein